MSKGDSSSGSRLYRLTRRLSSNALSQSWIGQRLDTGAPCFVKTINPESELGAALQDAVLAESFRCQAELRHPRIITATGLVRERGRLFIAYPYLDTTSWRPLDAETLAHYPIELLAEIALLVDYLHHLGYVHCDLKLSNFLIKDTADGFSIRLVDLDFLCPVGTRPNAKVMGAPGFIAPEILNNDEIYRQSDIYSMGASLRRALAGGATGLSAASWERMTAGMTVEDPLLRPRTMVAALEDCGLIDSAALSELNRRLLAMVLVTRFRMSDRASLGDRQRLQTLLADVGLLGIDFSLLELIARYYATNRIEAVRFFGEFIRNSAVQQVADYFTITSPDEFLLPFMNKLGACLGLNPVPPGRPLAEYVHQARRLAESGQHLWGYLGLRQGMESAEAGGNGDETELTEAWSLLGELAGGMGRLRESIAARLKFAERIAADDPRRFPALYQVARSSFLTMQVSESEALADRLLAEAIARGDLVQEVMVRRLQAMIQLSQRRCDIPELVRKTITEVAERIPPVELALSHYTAASVLLRQGQPVAARDHALRALELVRHAGAKDRLMMVLSELVGILHELGDHIRARHYALAGVRLAGRRGELGPMHSLLSNLVGSCSRLGNRKESEYWESRLIVQLRHVSDIGAILAYSNSLGYARLQRGDLRGAKEIFALAMGEHGYEMHRTQHYKALYNLAECAYWQGEPELCDRYAGQARPLMEASKDQLSTLELNLIVVLNDIYNRDQRDLQPLHELLQPLLDRHDTYCALECAFMLILLDDAGRAEIARTIEPVLETVAGSSVPLFRALEGLVPVLKGRSADPTAFLRVLKEAFRVFVRGGQKFLGAVTGYRIAEQYLLDGRDALGLKYLTQVARITESLGNRRFHGAVTERIATVRKSADSHRRLVQSIHGISQVLREMGQYEDSLTRLVEFAVNETGAERGAMLLKSPRSSEFFVAAYYNCDEGTLGDITDISSRVPQDASRALKPLVIDDATADDRTKEYQSVIEYNILSVICVPIVREDETVGALYLDHHTIPALFEPDDITYIVAIANFMALVISTLRQYRSVTIVNRELMADLNRSDGGAAFVTNDPTTLEMLQPLGEIALSDRPVLIMGESGTGKDVLANKIHELSRRAGKPMVHFNSTALPEAMVESELFGIVRGAATGVSEREGKFMAADGGTLFFDEIGDMPLAMQAKILTAVETQRFERVGSNRTVWVDVRFIYATNKDLREMIERSAFRQDLYQRMNFFTIEIPPLRERPGDIPLLIDHFIKNMSRERPAPKFSRAAMEAVVAYSWPGNVRELKNMVERFCIVHAGKEIGVNLLPRDIQNVRSSGGYGRDVAEAVERGRMEEALTKHNGNASRAARELGMPVSTFRRRARKYGLL